MQKSLFFLTLFSFIFWVGSCTTKQGQFEKMKKNYLENYQSFEKIHSIVNSGEPSEEEIKNVLGNVNCETVSVFTNGYVELRYAKNQLMNFAYGIAPEKMTLNELSEILERYEQATIFKGVIIGVL